MPEKTANTMPRFPIPPASETRRPGNGFYQYINQTWLKKTRIPSWLSEYGASEEIEKRNRKEIEDILKKCPDRLPEVGEIPKDAKGHLGFFQTVWRNSKHENEEIHLKGLITQIMDCRGPEDFAYLLGWLTKAGITSVINIQLDEEHKKPFFIRKTLTPTSLTLPNSYYTAARLRSDPVCQAYIEYIGVCSLELGIPYLMKAIDAEIELSDILSMHTNEDKVTELRGGDLIKWAPDFLWHEFMDGLGFSKSWLCELWLIDDPDCLKRMIRWICNVSEEKVAALVTLRLLNVYAEYLRPEIQAASFKFFKKELRGVKKPLSDDRRLIDDIGSALPDALCSEFAKVQHSDKKLKEVEALINGIKEAAIDTMSENESLTKKTTRQVIEKINRMKLHIGSPELEDLPKSHYFPDSLIHTSMSIASERNADAFTKSGNATSRKRLTYPCFIVNASYYQESNQIVIPWGILHCPFFCEVAPIGWNHGGTGATIAHEISHAFDIEGSQFNPKAKFKQWWTRKDKAHFRQRTRKMADFFTQHKRFGLHLNGEKTLSENWADFGGIVIALNALKRELLSMKASEETKKEAIKTFFIGYAVSWRDQMRKKKILYNIIKSVHSLPEDRVDLIVPHFQEWVDAFDVKESDPLFIPIGKRLKFF